MIIPWVTIWIFNLNFGVKITESVPWIAIVIRSAGVPRVRGGVVCGQVMPCTTKVRWEVIITDSKHFSSSSFSELEIMLAQLTGHGDDAASWYGKLGSEDVLLNDLLNDLLNMTYSFFGLSSFTCTSKVKPAMIVEDMVLDAILYHSNDIVDAQAIKWEVVSLAD